MVATPTSVQKRRALRYLWTQLLARRPTFTDFNACQQFFDSSIHFNEFGIHFNLLLYPNQVYDSHIHVKDRKDLSCTEVDTSRYIFYTTLSRRGLIKLMQFLPTNYSALSLYQRYLKLISILSTRQLIWPRNTYQLSQSMQRCYSTSPCTVTSNNCYFQLIFFFISWHPHSVSFTVCLVSRKMTEKNSR